MEQIKTKLTHSDLNDNIIRCKKCKRLGPYCQKIAKTKIKRFLGQEYWGKPVPSFGDAKAKLWIVGLAPGAHGANRTGRVFTGDQSGIWLYKVLFETGFSNKAQSNGLEDGLELKNTFISCVLKCAPPQNKPLPSELNTCQDWLRIEFSYLRPNLKVILALGKIAFDQILKLLKSEDITFLNIKNKPTFKHGLELEFFDPLSKNRGVVICSYHPSQQNTFTKKLTWAMWDHIFKRAQFVVQK